MEMSYKVSLLVLLHSNTTRVICLSIVIHIDIRLTIRLFMDLLEIEDAVRVSYCRNERFL